MDQAIKVDDVELSSSGLLRQGSEVIHLPPKELSLLQLLVSREGEVVSRKEIEDSLWPRQVVGYASLARCVYSLRKKLERMGHCHISTVPRRGYRLEVATRGTSSLTVGEANPPDGRTKALAICDEASHRLYDSSHAALTSALAMYEQAARLDPTCARAYIGSAQAWYQLLSTGQAPTQSVWPEIQWTLDEAMRATPTSADVFAVLAKGHYLIDWNQAVGQSLLSEALRLNPATYLVNESAGRISLFLGNPQAAAAHLERALEANPLVMATNGCLAHALVCAGKVDSALEHIQKVFQLDSNNVEARAWFGWIHAVHGDARKARNVMVELCESYPQAVGFATSRAIAHARLGEQEQARATLQALEAQPQFANRSAATTAVAWHALGDRAGAIRALESAVVDRDYWLGPILQDPTIADLRAEPTFRMICAKVLGAPTEATQPSE